MISHCSEKSHPPPPHHHYCSIKIWSCPIRIPRPSAEVTPWLREGAWTCHMSSMCTHCPELDEILQHSGSDEHTVNHGVGQEQDEVFIIGEAHAVVHPGSVKADQIAWFNPCKAEVRGTAKSCYPLQSSRFAYGTFSPKPTRKEPGFSVVMLQVKHKKPQYWSIPPIRIQAQEKGLPLSSLA